ncbi:hypothetical protein [Wolbachia sp. wLmal]|uniref:hypothetical protein n=1 Tax=Wolbachia sp. wLmal TaxID=3342489 RepID=UPI003C2F67CB
MKDIWDKVVALAIIGGMMGGIASIVLILIKLMGMIISFVLSLASLKVVLAYLALGLIRAIVIDRQTSSSPSIKKIIVPLITVCRTILTLYIAGFVLSFISSSPLIMGGMIGFMYPALSTILFSSAVSSYNSNEKDEAFDRIFQNSKTFFIKLGIMTVIGTAVGIGLGAAVSAIFPNVMLGKWSIALASTAIGAIVFPVEIFTAELITLSAIKKLETFTAFVVNKVTERFSSKESEPSEQLSGVEALKALGDLPYVI